VAHRLSVAGLPKQSQTQLFPASTINKLFHLSGGVPRLINVLCDRALLGTFVQGQSRVNKPTLSEAAREVFGETKVLEQNRKPFAWALAILLLIVVGTALAAIYYNHESRSVPENITETQNLGIVQKTQPSQLDTLKWPEDQPVHRSEELAYQALFNLWNIAYQSQENNTACQQAQAQGLRCLNGRGSLSNLRHLNRPAVLKLFDDNGREFYATLTSLSGQTATFIVGTETTKVDVKEIALRWFGEYTLLWQTPPNYQGNILSGNQGPEVQWLEKQLALIQGRTAQQLKNPVFDDEMLRQVKNFQLAEGLVPDGIVGTQTLIHLNTAVGSGIPKLIENQEVK